MLCQVPHWSNEAGVVGSRMGWPSSLRNIRPTLFDHGAVARCRQDVEPRFRVESAQALENGDLGSQSLAKSLGSAILGFLLRRFYV